MEALKKGNLTLSAGLSDLARKHREIEERRVDLRRQRREIDAELVAAIVLHLRSAASESAEDFARSRLGLRGHEAKRRIAAARAARKCPRILEDLRAGRLTFSGISTLAKHLDKPGLIKSAHGKTTREIEELIAHHEGMAPRVIREGCSLRLTAAGGQEVRKALGELSLRYNAPESSEELLISGLRKLIKERASAFNSNTSSERGLTSDAAREKEEDVAGSELRSERAGLGAGGNRVSTPPSQTFAERLRASVGLVVRVFRGWPPLDDLAWLATTGG